MKRLLLGVLFLLSSIVCAGEVKVTLKIKGMTCSLCVTSINQALRKTEGVMKAKAFLKTESAEVVVPDTFDHQKLLNAITKTGYTGQVVKVEKLP